MSRIKRIKMHEILKGKLYQRGEFRNFDLHSKLAALEQRNIQLIANLIKIPDEELKNREPFFYFHYPIPDGKLSEEVRFTLLEYSRTFALAIEQHKVAAVIHCHAGRNRSSLFTGLILMRLTGVNGKQAVEIIRSVRPNALSNDNFAFFLESFSDGLPLS